MAKPVKTGRFLLELIEKWISLFGSFLHVRPFPVFSRLQVFLSRLLDELSWKKS